VPYGFYPGVSAGTPSPTEGEGMSKYFREYDEALGPALEASKRAAEQRNAATVAMTEQALTQVQSMQNPAPQMPVPEVDPVRTALAGFFAHLNQSQTGSGQAVAGVQNMLSNTVAQGQRAQEANLESAARFGAAKQQSTEELHMQLLKAKRDQAAEMGNLDETFQHNKALYALERQKRKEEIQLQQQKEAAVEGAKQKNRIDLINQRGAQSRLTASYVARLRKEAESHAATPAQRARLAMANAEAAELRASVDDMRGAKDVDGITPLYSDDEIAAREDTVKNEIRTVYQSAIQDFESEKEKGTLNTAPTDSTVAPPPAGSDRIKAAAARLRGTPLFN